MIWLLGFVVFWVPWLVGFALILYVVTATIWDRLTDGHWWWELPEDMRPPRN
jgi:phage shock protein PspC (stress-responsive transcriptional regulator)